MMKLEIAWDGTEGPIVRHFRAPDDGRIATITIPGTKTGEKVQIFFRGDAAPGLARALRDLAGLVEAGLPSLSAPEDLLEAMP